jgi:hypothetical protein
MQGGYDVGRGLHQGKAGEKAQSEGVVSTEVLSNRHVRRLYQHCTELYHCTYCVLESWEPEYLKSVTD